MLLEGSGQAPESAPFLHAVRDHLGDLGVHIVTTRATDAQRSLVATVRAAREAAVREHADCTVWVDLPRAGDIVLYLLEPQTPHLWTRKMRARDETPAAAIERVGLIARWAVAALIEGRQVEMDPDPETVAIATVETPPPAPERAPPPKAPPPSRIMRGSIGASYTGSTFSGDVPWESGLALSVKWRLDGGFVVGAGYRFLLPATVESPMASARVTRHPAELSIGYRSGRDSFFWFTEVGAMLDYTVRSTTAVFSGLRPTARERSPRGGSLPTPGSRLADGAANLADHSGRSRCIFQ